MKQRPLISKRSLIHSVPFSYKTKNLENERFLRAAKKKTPLECRRSSIGRRSFAHMFGNGDLWMLAEIELMKTVDGFQIRSSSS